MSWINNAANWEMPVSKVPNCKWHCSKTEEKYKLCWSNCRNQKNITNSKVIKIIEI
jgi:hypothetical protein